MKSVLQSHTEPWGSAREGCRLCVKDELKLVLHCHPRTQRTHQNVTTHNESGWSLKAVSGVPVRCSVSTLTDLQPTAGLPLLSCLKQYSSLAQYSNPPPPQEDCFGTMSFSRKWAASPCLCTAVGLLSCTCNSVVLLQHRSPLGWHLTSSFFWSAGIDTANHGGHNA